MATTTAAITITSTDLTTDSLSLSTTATLTKAGTANGLDQLVGVSRKTVATAGVTTIFASSDYTADRAHKLYVKNTFIGGSDIITEMTMSGELDQLFTEKSVSFSQDAAAKIREENS